MAQPLPIDLGVLDLMMQRFASAMTAGWIGLTPEALKIFSSLAVAEVALVTPMYLLAREAVWKHIFYLLLKFGFFVVLVRNLKWFTETFMNWVVWAGLQIGGGTIDVPTFLSPGNIMLMGTQTTTPLLEYIQNLQGPVSSIINGPTILAMTIMMLIAWLCFFLIAAHIIIALIEFQLLSVMGLILLPWGVFRHTAFLAEGIVGGIVGSAVRLGVLAAITSIIVPVLASQQLPIATSTGNIPWQAALALCAAAGVMLIISWKAPNYAAALLGSGPAMTGQTAVTMGAVAVAAGAKALSGVPGAMATGVGAGRRVYARARGTT